MKIAPLLAQYLYTHKRLDLPGLGTFLLDPSTPVEFEPGKQGKSAHLEGVSFENKPSIRDTPDLVQFISSQTGKIKALAAADLESHLGLAQQFLNIGKPFLFEGIGSLVKIRSGEYNFSSGQPIYVSPAEQFAKEAASSNDNAAHDYKSVFYPRPKKMSWKKPAAVFLLLAGLALAIWGGYTVYKRTSSDKQTVAVAEPENIPVESTTIPVTPDTVAAPASQASVASTAATVHAGKYKYVLEKANAQRAFARFSRLKTFQWDVQMETKDSLSYTLYMLLPGEATDTIRVIDSLSRLNGRKVFIE